MTDVTADLAREHVELGAREAIAAFQDVLVDRSGFDAFFEEGASLMDMLVHGRTRDLAVVKRAVHTLKGDAMLQGLRSIATLCHGLEDYIEQENAIPAPAAYEDLRDRWGRLASN